MTIHHFKLQGEFIELNVLLKLLALVHSGGGAKALIAEGAVSVDGAIETRIRRKLRDGSVVRVGDDEIRVMVGDAPSGDSTEQAPNDAAEPRPENSPAKQAPRKRRISVVPSTTPSPWKRAGGKVVT